MISVTEAGKQISRLAQMRGYPRGEPEAMKGLSTELQEAETLDEAKAIMAGFLEGATSETNCPMPSEIRHAVYERKEEYRPDQKCPKCHGSGDIFTERGGLGYSKRCDCWARRPAPKWERPTEPMLDFTEQIRQAAETMRVK